jgi:predicted nucleic acid-binding protein
VNTFVIDASIVVKWVINEEGTENALALRGRTKLIAPELLTAECANIFWKKVQRDELTMDEACFAARLVQVADIELLQTRALLEAATRIAIELNHPAYDCVYIALATEHDCRFVTADRRLLRKLERAHRPQLRHRVISLSDAVGDGA